MYLVKAPKWSTLGGFKLILSVDEKYIYIVSSPSQRVVPCSVGEMDSAIQRHIKGGMVVICTSTAQEAKRLLQVMSSSLSSLPVVHTHTQKLLKLNSKHFFLDNIPLAQHRGWGMVLATLLPRDFVLPSSEGCGSFIVYTRQHNRCGLLSSIQ